jgi:hypothetical protein
MSTTADGPPPRARGHRLDHSADFRDAKEVTYEGQHLQQSEYAVYASLALALVLVVPTTPPPDDGATTKASALQPDPSWRSMGRNLWFDPKAKKVVLRARVVLREGYLEHFMCSKGTKEHEAILATDAVPHLIHAALLLTGAEPGHTVRFLPKFEPPTGTEIAIDLRWQQDGQMHESDARQWVRDEKAKAPLAIDWVFAGSEFVEDPVTKKKVYAADEGDLITVANFGSAILDLPVASSADDADRVFVTNTAKIPPLGTEVFVKLGPREAKKADEKPALPAARRP